MPRDPRQLLLASPLFDAEWYALRTGAQGDRAALVEHYLATPLEHRVSPHPLFDPEWFREQSPLDLAGKDPFLVYLRRRAFGTPTHPAFSTVHYRRTVEGAKEHPYGPLAHYVEVGAPAGIPGNRFLPPDAGGRPPDLRAWHLERHRALLAPPPALLPANPTAAVVTVVVLVPAAPSAWRAAWETVSRVVEQATPEGTTLQVVVLDAGAAPDDAVKLDVLALRHPAVEVVHPDRSTGTLAVTEVAELVGRSRGVTTVLLGHAVEVWPGWLAPLVAAMSDEDVLAAQPLVLRPDGTLESAGVVVPADGAAPYAFLSGFPVEDAAGAGDFPHVAVAGACVAVRTADVARLTRSGLLDVGRSGRCRVCPSATVTQRARGPWPFVTTGATVPPDDEARLWRGHGFAVVGRDPDSGAPLLRRRRAEVAESPPRMRWAIKNPAPAGPMGERWGDTHFATSLAAALREAGQEVVVDRREAFDRESGRHDDVHLLLRGLAPLPRRAHGVTLAWVISHPAQVQGPELRAYDRVLAASVTWAREQSRRWRIEVEPLLQATDHRLFHPDAARPDSGERALFVGSARGVYRPLVRAAVEHDLPLGLYGTGWEEFVPAGVVHGQYVPNDELAAAYRAAGVVLNDHWEDMRREGFLSNRLFDAVASGARVLTDDVAGLGDLFGRSVQVVRTPDDLVRLASLEAPDAVFGDDAERRAVAERVRREHSFAARAERLVEVAAQALRQRPHA